MKYPYRVWFRELKDLACEIWLDRNKEFNCHNALEEFEAWQRLARTELNIPDHVIDLFVEKCGRDYGWR